MHFLASPKTVNQCTIPQFISVSYTKGDAIYFMEFTSKTTAVGDVACSTVMELSGAVAGKYFLLFLLTWLTGSEQVL